MGDITHGTVGNTRAPPPNNSCLVLGIPGIPIYSSDRLWVLPTLMGSVSVPLTPRFLVLIWGPAFSPLLSQCDLPG